MGLIPGQGTYLGCRFDPLSLIAGLGTHNPQSWQVWRQPVDASLLHQCFSLSLPLSLKAMKKKCLQGTSGQNGGLGKHSSPPHSPPRTTKVQNNYNPELSENQALWKSDSQGIKEVTFIQRGRRGREAEQAVPHPHVVDKNWRDTLGVRDPSPRLARTAPRVPVPG